jgi:ubiquinone/menaquinone biosynthesis C-methylase UbiE
MDKLDHPEINTSELTAEVRKAIARQVLKRDVLPIHQSAIEDSSTPETTVDSEKDNSTQAQQLSTQTNFVAYDSHLSPLPKSPTWQLQPAFEPDGNDEYQLNDLLQFHDVNFVNAAYRAILKREPDKTGYSECLDQLREGHLDKIDLIWSLRFSPEGELKNVKINGLALPAFARRLGRLPIIGYPIRLGTGLLRLPSLIHRVRRHEAYSSAQSRQLAEHANKISEHIDTLGDTVAQHLSNLSAVTADLLNKTEVHKDQHGQMQQQLRNLIEQQQQIVAELRQELRQELQQELGAEIDTREQTQQLIQEQLSLVQASTNDTRDRTTKLESFTDDARDRVAKLESFTDNAHDRINQIESSNSETRNQIAQIEASANTLIAQLETSARGWIAQLESTVRAEIASVDANTNDTRARIIEADSVTGDLRVRLGTVESASNDLRSTTDKLETSTNTVQTEIEKVYQQLHHARTELALQGRRMGLILEEARRRLPAPFDQQQLEIIASEEQHKLDALYAELEDNFRGSHEEIKNRFRTYLPQIDSLVIAPDMPIVDLGSGRGEWLELLKEEGYTARGVDSNRVLLDRCRARGLDVVESDALQYLRGLSDNSLAAITGFHIIEHLEIGVLMQLLDETVRVVQPGGLVIFETPNPENVLVGSNYFYFDPTHRNPLPGLLMKFLLESRGFQRVEVINLHAWDQARIGGKNALTSRFNDLFYGPMDYAIAGWKVSA